MNEAKWIQDIGGMFIEVQAEWAKVKPKFEYNQEVYVTSDLFNGRGYFLKHYDVGHTRSHYVIDVNCIYERTNEDGTKEFMYLKKHTFEPHEVESIEKHEEKERAEDV